MKTEPDFARDGGESVESVEGNNPSSLTFAPLSTHSPGARALHDAVFPDGSWLSRYMDFARTREESVDSYFIGSILPVIGACLARRVFFPWGDRYIYPNLFTMLAGKPGDRKSSAINLAEKIARQVLDAKHFLPDTMSAEALFDEYDENKCGSPDKILIADDANAFLGLLQKSNYGERIGHRLLNLHDCKGLFESFRRNEENSQNSRREIAQTSTSIVLGGTFNICQFQGQAVRSGLQRRFNYYLAENHGRFIPFPPKTAHLEFLEITEKLEKIQELNNHEFYFEQNAEKIWVEFQRENRKRMENEFSGQDSYISRLNGQPEHVIKLAIIFEISVWLEKSEKLPNLISEKILEIAIEHSDLCLSAGKILENISHRAEIQSEADTLLAKISADFWKNGENGWINLTKTEITAKYASHAGRKNGLSADELYSRLIPDLIRRKKAQEIPRPGRRPSYSFKIEDV